MCWSYEVSLVTVTIVVSSVVLMLIRRASRQDVGNALWCSVFGSMQIIDLLLWMENDQGDLKSCSMSNQRITRYGFYIISLEPIASLLSRMYINKQFYPKTLLVYIFFFIILPWIGRDYLNDWCSDTYCTHLTEEGNLILGLGVDEKNGLACWMKYFFFGEHQTEIPLLLRVFFLVGIFAPFLGDVPLLKGLIHASIITITWLIGFFSASHASVWCMANVAQCLLCAVDPYLFPLHKAGSPVNRGKRGDILQDNYLKKKVPENLDAIVVGSGIGGLTTAAMMAKAGKRVLVLEQHYRAGGATHTFDEFGNLFDSGIHYVGANDFCVPILGLIGDVPVKWSQMGKKEDDFCYDEFDLGDPNDLYRYRKGREAIMEELLTRFPHEKEGIKAYFKNLGNAQMATYSFAILKILPLSWQNSFVGRWLFSLFLSKAADRSATEEVEKFIKDPKLRALLSGGQLIDWNLAPDRTSWWVVASMMSYYFDGGFYPVGGSQTIAQSIIPTIEKSGGRVLTNVRVEEFVMSDDEEAVIGIRLHNGDEISAPIVISDAGATNTYAKLLPLSALKKKGLDLSKLEKIQPSNGHMTAFVNFDGPSSKFDLRPANIHSFGDLPKFDYSISEMQRALYRDQKKYRDGCLITLTSPSAKDPEYEKMFPGCSNVLLLAEGKYEWFEEMGPQIHGERTESYLQFKKEWEEVFLNRLYTFFPKTKDHITRIEIGTPLSTEHFLAADKGGSYGLEWTPERFNLPLLSDFFHAQSRFSGLYLTGEASLFGGFCGAMVSGIISAYHVLGLREFLKVILFHHGHAD